MSEYDVRDVSSWIERCCAYYDRSDDAITFNDLIQMAMNDSNLEKVDDFFLDSADLIYWGIKPNTTSLDLVIQHCVSVGDLIRAEKYANMARHNFRPCLRSYVVLMQAYIERNEARRAHSWLDWILKNGFGIHASCPAEFVRIERAYDSTVFPNDEQNCLLDCISRVAEALAMAGNATTAASWLSYMIACDVRPEDYPETWEIVREAHPPDIIPAALWTESRRFPMNWRQKRIPAARIMGQNPVPAATRSIKLSGEAESPHRAQYLYSSRKMPSIKPQVFSPKTPMRRSSWRLDRGVRIFDEAALQKELDVTLPSEYVVSPTKVDLEQSTALASKMDQDRANTYSSMSTYTGASSPSPPPTRPTSSASCY